MEDGKTGRREKDVDPYRLGITIALLIQSLDLSTQLLVCDQWLVESGRAEGWKTGKREDGKKMWIPTALGLLSRSLFSRLIYPLSCWSVISG